MFFLGFDSHLPYFINSFLGLDPGEQDSSEVLVSFLHEEDRTADVSKRGSPPEGVREIYINA